MWVWGWVPLYSYSLTTNSPTHTRGFGRGTLKTRSREAPTARGWSSMATIAADDKTGKLLVFGGLSGDDEAPRRLDDTQVLELKLD